MIRKLFLGLALAAAALGLGAGPSTALVVSPMSYQLGVDGDGASVTLRVENRFSTPVAIEISVGERVLDGNGQEILNAADNDFTVFPPLATIEPGAVQAIRIKYVGDSGIGTSRS